MLDHPIASFTTTELRRPSVINAAFEHPIRVRVTGHDVPLIVLAESEIERNREVQELMALFLRTVVAIQRDETSGVILDRVSYIANWSRDDREQFLHGFAEALSASMQANDPRAANSFIRLMSHAADRTHDRSVTGAMSPDAELWVGEKFAEADSRQAADAVDQRKNS